MKEVRTEILEARQKYDIALAKLDYKIRKYEEAVQTGHLVWDEEEYSKIGEDNYDLQ